MYYAPENGEEIFDLGVLGFAHYNIYNTDNDEETFDLGVLGRGRAEQTPILYNFITILLKKFKTKSLFYVILSYLMRFYII